MASPIDWSAMTAEEIVAALDSRPVVMGPWEGGTERRDRYGSGQRVYTFRRGFTDWFAGLRVSEFGYERFGPCPDEASARALADEMAKARGWKLMGGGV